MQPCECRVFYHEGPLKIRAMEDSAADYSSMAEWLSDERVLQYYEGRDNPFDYERVVREFGPSVRGDEHVQPCIIEWHGRPVGYIQYYPLAGEPKALEEYGYASEDDVYGMDLFIGDTSLWNSGVGTAAVGGIIGYLLGRGLARRICIDPETWNTRAIRCYEKCGFKKLRILPGHEWHEGAWRDSWLMEIRKKY